MRLLADAIGGHPGHVVTVNPQAGPFGGCDLEKSLVGFPDDFYHRALAQLALHGVTVLVQIATRPDAHRIAVDHPFSPGAHVHVVLGNQTVAPGRRHDRDPAAVFADDLHTVTGGHLQHAIEIGAGSAAHVHVTRRTGDFTDVAGLGATALSERGGSEQCRQRDTECAWRGFAWPHGFNPLIGRSNDPSFQYPT
jgi:hypothetical protein